MSEPKTVAYETPAAHVARIVLDRPEARNAQDTALLYELNAAFDRAARDDAVKVIILAANGPHFSAGHDLRETGSIADQMAGFETVGTWCGFGCAGAEGRMAREKEIYLGLSERWRNIPKPTIAAVQGKCIAGGLMLAWPCDLIVAADDAAFCDNTVGMGVAGVEYFAHPWELGVRKAKELLFTADWLSAEEARAIGMVNHVVPAADLATFTLALAVRIAAKPMFALKMAKEAVNAAEDAQGRVGAMGTAFALHQLAHSHNMQVHGMPVDPAGLFPRREGQLLMHLDWSQEDLAFQAEVRTFLAQALTPELREAARLTTSVFTDPHHNRAWHQALYARGWVAPAWPVEYGGCGWNEMQRYIFASECTRAGAPGLSPMGLRMCGPMLMRFGTPEQKAFYLPRILSGEDYWCQGYSEPGSGSDLASLQLRATSDGDHYVLSGSKIWTTHAQFANRMFCLVRTGWEGRPQAGITFLLLDMNTPGLSVRPIITLAGDHEVNQVFFEDVRVPKANRVGEENAGWSVAKYLLEFERGGSSAAGLKASLARLRTLASSEPADGGGPLIADPIFRRRLAAAEIELDAIEMTEHRVMSALSSGQAPGPASSMLKTRGTEATQMLDELAIEAAGRYAAVDQRSAREPGGNVAAVGPPGHLTAMPRYLNNRAATIYGGSNEIQRNIMASLVLGL